MCRRLAQIPTRKLSTWKGTNKNLKQVAAAEIKGTADKLTALQEQRMRRKCDDAAAAVGSSPPRTHKPEGGSGGKQIKLDLDKLTPRSKAKLEASRRRARKFRLNKNVAAIDGVVSDAVLT